MKKQYIALSLITILSSTNILPANETINPSAPKSIEKKDTLLVIVNGHEIWESYFDKSFQKMTANNKNNKIDDIINAELLVQYASKQKLFHDKALNLEVKAYGEKLKAKGKKFTDKDYRMVLGLTVIDRLSESLVKNDITDEEVNLYYKQRKKNFKYLPFVDTIVLTLTSKNDIEKILKIMKDVKESEKKETFLSFAKKYTKEKKDTYIKREYKFGLPTTPFTIKLFSLKKGAYTKNAIEMPDNTYRLIYCVNKGTVSKAPSREELDKNIRFILTYKKKLAWVTEKINELKKKSKIEIKKKF